MPTIGTYLAREKVPQSSWLAQLAVAASDSEATITRTRVLTSSLYAPHDAGPCSVGSRTAEWLRTQTRKSFAIAGWICQTITPRLVGRVRDDAGSFARDHRFARPQ